MDNSLETFYYVDNIVSYARNNIITDKKANRYNKSGIIHAVNGTPGERIVTVLKNGLEETENTVGTDAETGVPDWIVTAPTGERYIVKDAVFREKYKPAPDEFGAFIPIGKPIEAVQIHKNIRFIAPWGEEQRLLAGGFLILDPGGIYGVAEEEFLKTYIPAEECPD